jgi:hypothetical protein
MIINYYTFSFNAMLFDGLFTNQLTSGDWHALTTEVVEKLNDDVINQALTKLPPPIYQQMQAPLEKALKERRSELLKKSPDFYRFLNRIVDITASDKNELVELTGTPDKKLSVSIHKMSKSNEPGRVTFQRVFDPGETKEIRLYLYGGHDSVIVNNNTAGVKLRIIGDPKSPKQFHLGGSPKYLRKIHIYNGISNGTFQGDAEKAHLHLSDHQENTGFQVTARYHKTIPLLNVGYNVDEGFIFGGGVRFIRQGFRKNPYGSSHQFTLVRAFATKGYKFRYTSEWLKLVGNTDFLMSANVFAPDNTQNFFGRGNETPIDKTGNFRRFYRTVFTIVQVEPALRWRSSKNSFSIGPSFQYYNFDHDDNKGRFITNTSRLNSYDSSTISHDKGHLGMVMNYVRDSRNSQVLPTTGNFVTFKVRGYNGLNDYSKSFAQVTTDIAVFRPLGRKANIVIANRVGGGVSLGKTTFYQSLFLGGQENLLGYHQFRFAGKHMLYNNLEARVKIASLASYLVPGQLGLVAFYDIGRVWEDNQESKKWHQGVGAGIYFSPAQLIMLQFVAGKSVEGWYPYFTMGFRF